MFDSACGFLGNGQNFRATREAAISLRDASSASPKPASSGAGQRRPRQALWDLQYLNERKWDDRRDWDLASKGRKPREFDASKPKREGPHWRPYSAEDDPHLRDWLQKQRANRLTHVEDEPAADRTVKLRDRTVVLHDVPLREQRYIPYGHPPVPGLPLDLAKRLKAAQEELDAARKARK